MAFIDYYKILGIDKTASQEDIKKAYRKLARKYHPDLNPDDKTAHRRFQEINEANEALSDPDKRKKYDEYGEHWKNAEQFEQAKNTRGNQQAYEDPFAGAGYNTSDFGSGNFSDFFESMFGGARSGAFNSKRKAKGQDFQADLSLSLENAYKTHKQTLTVNGKQIRITIPAGIKDGQVIKLNGQGGPGTNGGPNGNLFITFRIKEDPFFKRLNDDLYTTEKIDLYTAVLGGEVTVRTFDGKVKLQIAPGTENGTKVRLKNKGFPVYKNDGAFGSHVITYEVKIPKNLSARQKELFKELQLLEKS